MIDDLEATIQQLRADGIPAQMFDPTQVTKFRALYDAAVKPGEQPRARSAALKQLRAAVTKASKDLKADADRQTRATTTGADQAIEDLRKAAQDLIDPMVVKDANDPKDPKTALAARLKALTDEIPDAAKVTDQAKLEAARKQAEADAKALIKDAAKAAGDDDPKVRQKVQDAYQKAIKEKYGISFGQGPDEKLAVKYTHLDDFYDVLEKVPVGHVAHKNMRDLTYVKGLDGIGKFTGVGIELGTMPKDGGKRSEADPKDNQDIPEKHKVTTQENKFAITVLHELGHSVDQRWNLIPGIQSDAKCGGWIEHGWGDIARQLIADFQQSHARTPVTEAQLHAAALAALVHGATAPAPEGIDPTLWTDVSNHFGPWAEMHSRSYPWIGDPVPYKSRSYVFGKWAGAQWFSYLPTERAKMHITDYQWSSPREWFAELYALCWHKNEPAPSFVHDKVKAFMPGGSSAAPPEKP